MGPLSSWCGSDVGMRCATHLQHPLHTVLRDRLAQRSQVAALSPGWEKDSQVAERQGVPAPMGQPWDRHFCQGRAP